MSLCSIVLDSDSVDNLLLDSRFDLTLLQLCGPVRSRSSLPPRTHEKILAFRAMVSDANTLKKRAFREGRERNIFVDRAEVKDTKSLVASLI